MSNQQHASGPWKAMHNGTFWEVNYKADDQESITEYSPTVAIICGEKEENARLIAAAPELLEFAMAVVRYAGNSGDDYLADKAREAIAKATNK